MLCPCLHVKWHPRDGSPIVRNNGSVVIRDASFSDIPRIIATREWANPNLADEVVLDSVVLILNVTVRHPVIPPIPTT